VLGPVDCGQIDQHASSWRLSPGKRLTVSVVKAQTDARGRSHEQQVQDALAANNKKEAAEKEETGGTGQIMGILISFVPILISFLYFYVWK